jgi:hypothetical protein
VSLRVNFGCSKTRIISQTVESRYSRYRTVSKNSIDLELVIFTGFEFAAGREKPNPTFFEKTSRVIGYAVQLL